MMEGRPFLYEAKNRTVYRVNEEGVQAIRSRSSDEKIVAFVDGDTEGYPVTAQTICSTSRQCRLLWQHPQETQIEAG